MTTKCFSSGETERGVVKVCWDHQGLLLLFSSLYCYPLVQADIERERKGRAGVENLAKALQVLSIIFILTGLSAYDWHHCNHHHHHQETPKFGGEESQADVQDKLQHMRSMMTYLEASRSMMTLMMMMMTYLETSLWLLVKLVKIIHTKSIITIIPPRYKALNIMMDVEGRPRVVHPVSSYIDYSKDKQGFTQVS